MRAKHYAARSSLPLAVRNILKTHMNRSPNEIGGAKVVLYTPIDDRHQLTGNCRQIVCGETMGAAAGLAICQYPGENNYYLFGCDENWNTITDTWHETLEDAKAQAEFEYMGASATWLEP